ncbi:MAG TPA: helix-turn-helix domain-containing protein, partial [Polyangiaceae bacterium]|nr:helix-turn-helix domain-containing protein [Polyangiaceae bacterium]
LDHVLLDASPDVYLYSIGVDPNLASEVGRAATDAPTLPLRSQIRPSELEHLIQRCSDVVDRAGVDDDCAELWQRAQWLQSNSTSLGGAVHVLTRRALAELTRFPDVSRESLARTLRASPSDVSRYFHRDVGVTLVQYRTRARLLRLIREVDRGERNLKELACQVGFGSYSQCHRAFMAELRCAPRAFFVSGMRQQMQDSYALK